MTSVAWIDAKHEQPRIGLESGAEFEAAALVLATDPATVRRLAVESALGDEAWRERAAAMCTAPPFAVWRLWLNRGVAPDRPAFLGTSGFGPLDNISVLERFEEGSPQLVSGSRRLGCRAARVRAGRAAGRARC